MTAFNAERLEELLEREVRYFESCESTQLEARVWAKQGAPAGSLVVANSQHGGRGRLGRSWHSEAGMNLAFSLIVRPPIRIQDAPLLCLAAGVGLAESLRLRLKWPNDLLGPDGEKIAGILAEMEGASGRLQYAILGIGINVNQTDFPEDLPNPGSLAILRGEQDRSILLRDGVFAVEKWCAEIADRPERLLTAWRQRSAHLGLRVRVGEHEGIAEDLRSDGALLLRLSNGEVHPVLAGDVQMIPQTGSD